MKASSRFTLSLWLLLGWTAPLSGSEEERPITEKDRQHWAFQAPKVQSGASIDSLIDARLKSAGIEPVGRAVSHHALTGFDQYPECQQPYCNAPV